MSLTAEPFGVLPDGSPVIRYTLSRTGGMTLRFWPMAASTRVWTSRTRVDGWSTWFAASPHCMRISLPPTRTSGGQAGRFANRLAGGRFSLDDDADAIPDQTW